MGVVKQRLLGYRLGVDPRDAILGGTNDVHPKPSHFDLVTENNMSFPPPPPNHS